MDYIAIILQKYKSKGIIVDTNILILYVAGFYDLCYLEKISRVNNKQYSKDDFEAIAKLLSKFQVIYITPQILSELSNLSFKDEKNRDKKDDNFSQYLLEVVRIITSTEEYFSPKNDLMQIDHFPKFGFTDMSILDLAIKKELPVITDDLGLYHLLINSSIDCLNMNTIRMYSI